MLAGLERDQEVESHLLAHLHDRPNTTKDLLANTLKTTYMTYAYVPKGEELDKNIYIPPTGLPPEGHPSNLPPCKDNKLWWHS